MKFSFWHIHGNSLVRTVIIHTFLVGTGRSEKGIQRNILVPQKGIINRISSQSNYFNQACLHIQNTTEDKTKHTLNKDAHVHTHGKVNICNEHH